MSSAFINQDDELAILYHALRELPLKDWRGLGSSDIRLLFRLTKGTKFKKVLNAHSVELGQFIIQLAHLSYACRTEEMFIGKAKSLTPPLVSIEENQLLKNAQTNLAYHIKTKRYEKLVALGPLIQDGFFNRIVQSNEGFKKVAC